jgi:hypothetical protein
VAGTKRSAVPASKSSDWSGRFQFKDIGLLRAHGGCTTVRETRVK